MVWDGPLTGTTTSSPSSMRTSTTLTGKLRRERLLQKIDPCGVCKVCPGLCLSLGWFCGNLGSLPFDREPLVRSIDQRSYGLCNKESQCCSTDICRLEYRGFGMLGSFHAVSFLAHLDTEKGDPVLWSPSWQLAIESPRLLRRVICGRAANREAEVGVATDDERQMSTLHPKQRGEHAGR